ncbi:MAG: hypothetical protein JRJ02_14875 [Deltaproteobacteria bacterium]|nr:hypothetical protein [Deltaproteobacteria bacterium]
MEAASESKRGHFAKVSMGRDMEIAFPGLCFLTSATSLKFDTDGYTTSFQPTVGPASGLEHVLVLIQSIAF